MAKLEVRNLHKSFGPTKVLDAVSFAMDDAKLLSILGPSGCGKSTILRIVSGFLPQDQGQIIVDGKDISSLPPERREIGMVFQSYALFPHMNVYENIAYGLRVRKAARAEIQRRLEEVLILTRLQGMEKRRIQELSGGQQQRVALARALVLKPKILLLDEPLSALDRKIRGEMQYEIRNIQHKVGITTVFVTHDQEEALTLSDQVILLNQGRVEQMADPWAIYNRPASLFASDFLGRANIIPGLLERMGEQWVFRSGELALPVQSADGFQNGQLVNAVIRAEHIRLHSAADAGNSRLSGVIQSNLFTGMVAKLEIKLPDAVLEVITLAPSVKGFKPGMAVWMDISAEDVHCFPREEGGK